MANRWNVKIISFRFHYGADIVLAFSHFGRKSAAQEDVGVLPFSFDTRDRLLRLHNVATGGKFGRNPIYLASSCANFFGLAHCDFFVAKILA